MGDTDVEQQETSIEEILASIRRIIAEDEDESSVSFTEGKPSGAVATAHWPRFAQSCCGAKFSQVHGRSIFYSG